MAPLLHHRLSYRGFPARCTCTASFHFSSLFCSSYSNSSIKNACSRLKHHRWCCLSLHHSGYYVTVSPLEILSELTNQTKGDLVDQRPQRHRYNKDLHSRRHRIDDRSPTAWCSFVVVVRLLLSLAHWLDRGLVSRFKRAHRRRSVAVSDGLAYGLDGRRRLLYFVSFVVVEATATS